MKHHYFVPLLLALCLLCGTASAETLAQRTGAPESVTVPAFSTESGLTSITIDAAVTVPQVERVPLFRVEIEAFTEETARAMAAALGVDASGAKWDDYTGNDGNFAHLDLYPRDDLLQCTLTRTRLPDGTTESANLRYANARLGDYDSWHITPYPAERDGTLTRDAAAAQAERLVQAITGDRGYRLYEEGALRGYVREWDLTAEQKAALERARGKDPSMVPQLPYAYAFHFTRDLAGIPLPCTEDYMPLWAVYGQLTWQNDPNAPKSYRLSYAVSERLSVALSDEGVYSVDWESPSVVKETLQEDCELLPFADILALGQQELLDFYAYYEAEFHGEVSFAVNVWDIRFGYLRMLDVATGRLILTPVWDFFATEAGTNHKAGFTNVDDGLGRVAITLSAIDGSPMPRSTT